MERFKAGDRVRARTWGFVPLGTLGTVLRQLRSARAMYAVQFDGLAQFRLMPARDLEHIADEPLAKPRPKLPGRT